ncbi:unnamed protein product [Adineta steineri]|uniref:Uncharacterized protein n=1 Tax=Adineta steineri TaxID=433720 RepID=A0A815MGU5_9BILA|nr:unnamed protein product [Adineta steineri]CAF1619881.1 unnamed protein product [Adineta steineri]
MNNSSKIPITSSLSSITTTDNIQQQQTIVKKKQKRIKRCHGDRKKQRYRKKCRAKGMKPATIAKRVKKRFKDNNNPTTQLVTTNDNTVTNTSTTSPSHKRKRDLTINQVVRSASQLSITTSPPKKMTKTKINNATTTTTAATATTTSVVTHNDNIYRCAPYLKRTSSILLQALRLQLEHPLKKKIEQRFIFQRLQLLDKQFCLEIHRFLWQSYLNIGSQQQQQQYTWPDEIYTKFQTKDSRLCYQSIEKYIHDIQYQLEQCNKILMEQNSTCPESISIDICDVHLKKYIESQQKQFRQKINHQLSKFKECIQEQQLHHTLFNDNVTKDQNKTIHQLINIQDKQLNC